ncbi:hypothetical protein MKW98_030661 [Papaver atlanticum]|uniref:EXPERA domain-containing protein n=1 Tax=Papaver atlanticum TaxID=357466 RepID=A0AAD4RTY8_9MAGN|nr:hypothetical protein MKW98_030661 [Papaver atlanticum]
MFLQKLINGFLSIYFLFLSIQIPLLNAQIILPIEFFPKFLVELKPHFRVGLAWVELLLYWPLAIASVYGLLNKRSWSKKTCLIYVAILSELIGSAKGSPKLVSNFYGPFMIATVICIVNGLTTTSSSSSRTPMPRKSSFL